MSDTLRPAFLFTGQGAQYPLMGRQLYRSLPVFRQAMDQCDRLLRGVLERPLLEVIDGAGDTEGLLDQTGYTQPALFCIEYALSRVWASWGVTPSAVLGHSVGEYAAACVAGVFSLEDGLSLISERGRLMQALPAGGGMLAVLADAPVIDAILAEHRGRVELAADNGPRNKVLSGTHSELDAVAARLSEDGVRTVRLAVSHAFHSALMEPMLDAFLTKARGVRFRAPSLPFVSNVFGAVAAEEVAAAEYWVRHLRETVRFADGIAALAGLGVKQVIEIGPRPLLIDMGRAALPAATPMVWLPSLKPGVPDAQVLEQAVAALRERPGAVDETAFERDRRLLTSEAEPGAKESRYSLSEHPFLDGHRVAGPVVVPAAMQLIRAATTLDGELREVVFHRPMELIGEQPLIARWEMEEAAFSLVSDDTVYVTGIRQTAQRVAPRQVDLTALKQRCQTPGLAPSALYRRLAYFGVQLGPDFTHVQDIMLGQRELLARLSWAPPCEDRLHPGVLDCLIQLFYALVSDVRGMLPYAAEQFRLFDAPMSDPGSLWAHVRLLDSGDQEARIDCALLNSDGAVIAELNGLSLRAYQKKPSERLYHTVWETLPRTAPAAGEDCSVVDMRDCDVASALSRVQTTLSDGSSGRLLLISRGAVDADPTQMLASAGLWGLGAAIAQEYPDRECVRLDLDPVAPEWDEKAIRAAKAAPADEGQLLWREGRLLGARLQPLTLRTPAAEFNVRADATYLITGGLGGLGLALSQSLVAKGARHLALIGRSPPDAEARAILAELEASGAQVLIFSADVADRAALAQTIERIGREAPALRGVFHLAGVLDDAAVPQQDAERLRRVWAPKAQGAHYLHELTQDLPLDHFVLFSSLASALGSAGQSNYASANAYLDELARFRRRRGLPALSVQWGPWASVGMASRLSKRDQARWAEAGVRQIPVHDTRILLETALSSDEAVVAAIDADWARYLRTHSGAQTKRFLTRLVTQTTALKSASQLALLTRVAGLADAEQVQALQQRVQELVAAFLGLASHAEVTPDARLFDLGIDSLMSTELKSRLESELGVKLRSTLALDYPNARAIADYLKTQLPKALAAAGLSSGESIVAASEPRVLEAKATAVTTTPQRPSNEPVAIVGMAWRMPGGADTPETMWQFLREGGNAVRTVPSDRWDIEDYYDPDLMAPGKIASRVGGFLDRIDQFDPRFFGIAPREAVHMDPQQRLLLETVWHALEDAQVPPDRLVGSSTGVFVGVGAMDYGIQMLSDRERVGSYMATGGLLSPTAGRISYMYGLRGPSFAVDTACSSSLSALHLACQSLRNGECEQALVGGVNLLAAPYLSMVFSKAKMLSPTGSCKSFDAAADGYVRSEGCAVFMLKPLSAARRDGDRIHGLVLGTALNQDGASSGLTVPNGPAQEDVAREALARAGVRPHQVGYVEAHGTGTPLGDPIEVQALGEVYGEGRSSERPLKIGSIKSNLGHLEAASGMASLLKVLLAMRHRRLPPSLHFQTPNPLIPWESIPVQVVSEVQAFEPIDGRRIAGISSFGFVGTNAHVIIAESPDHADQPLDGATPDPTREADYRVLPISAHNPEALERLRQRYIDHLRREPASAWAAICAAATHGRKHFAHRLAVVASSPSQAAQLLSAGLIGDAAATPEQIASAHQYLAGEIPAWPSRPSAAAPLALSLPAYPFDRERYWLESQTPMQPVPRPAAFQLPGKRVALPFSSESRFELVVNPQSPVYLSEHRLLDTIVVPAAFYLSWVLAALRSLAPGHGYDLGDLLFSDALVLEAEDRNLQLIVESQDGVPTGFRVASQSGEEWRVHARGTIALLPADSAPVVRMDLPRVNSVSIDGEAFYARYGTGAPDYGWGPSYQWLERMWPGETQAWAKVATRIAAKPDDDGSPLFTGLIDSMFHVLVQTAVWRTVSQDVLRIPFSIGAFRYWPAATDEADLWASASVGADGRRLQLLDDSGRVVAIMEDMADCELRVSDLRKDAAIDASKHLYQIAWEPDESPADAASVSGLVVLAAPRSQPLASWLAERKQPVAKWIDSQADLADSCAELAALLAQTSGPVWCVTRGVLEGDPTQSAWSAMCRAVAAENPAVSMQWIDLDPKADTAADLTALDEAFAHAPDGEQAAYREGQRLIARLTRLPQREAGTRSPASFSADATYLVTGGLGALGRHTAQWLLARGAGHVVLVGRNVADGSEPISENASGRTYLWQADIADAGQARALLARISAELPPLKGIVHAAGALHDAVLGEQTQQHFQAALAAKAFGASYLDEAVDDDSLDFFVCFSSATSILGSRGQANYVVANGFVDGLMQQRRARGAHGLSINWGPWAGEGMAARLDPVLRKRIASQGFEAMSVPLGMAALEHLLLGDATHASAMTVDWPRYTESLGQVSVSPLVSRLMPRPAVIVPASSPSSVPTPTSGLSLRESVVQAAAEERLALVVNYLDKQLKATLGIASHVPIGPHEAFISLGLDSLMSFEFRNLVAKDLAMALPGTVIFEHSNLQALAGFLLGRFMDEEVACA